MSKTKIITIEGIDGSGKTVQFELLTKGLQDRGFTVQKRAYPVYDAFFGEQVGKFLSCSEGVSASTVDQKSMALWFCNGQDSWIFGIIATGKRIFCLSTAMFSATQSIRAYANVISANPVRIIPVLPVGFSVLNTMFWGFRADIKPVFRR